MVSFDPLQHLQPLFAEPRFRLLQAFLQKGFTLGNLNHEGAGHPIYPLEHYPLLCSTSCRIGVSTVRDDSLHSVIAIFDNDKEGADLYGKLPNYFEESLNLNVRIARHKKAAAFLLPVPLGREKYAEYLNLPIEFYFNDTALSLRTPEGFGLEFPYPQLETRIRRHGNPVVEVKESNIPETREIIGGKTVFAEQIVPSLDSSEFEAFKLLFKQIKQVLAYMANPN